MKRLFALTLALLVGGASYAQGKLTSFPVNPVKINVGFAAGGGTDLLARHYAKRLGEKLGQPFLVDNKPGKGGAIAVYATAHAPANGYTIVLGTTGIAVDAALGESSYDWQRDLAPIALLAAAPNVLVVPEKSPIRTVADVIRKAKQTHVTFGSAGVTSSMHMTGELFKQMAGVEMTHVPYRGAAPAEQALMAGEIDVMFDNIAGAATFIEAGKFRPIAISSSSRSAELPNVPTIAESGLPGFETTGSFFLMAPAKTPPEVLKLLEVAVDEISDEQDTQAFLKRMHMVSLRGGATAVSTLLQSDYAKWKRVVSAKGFEIDR
ncbi:tripartite tricarboxylate transporter substrate-binding protein [Variovorax robiniae]|uniref:Tripartite tricarboxylate transporter substrate-binding protein n=1 Tax=Variovorax robiniae TaxID=1836199 RepID=A0ABU8XFX8_9BURK